MTDARGRYRIIGVAKRSSYTLTLGGRKGVPYLGYTRHNVPDTPGLEPLAVDFELERGLEISGKVIDKATGKPVRGSVAYFHTPRQLVAPKYVTLGKTSADYQPLGRGRRGWHLYRPGDSRPGCPGCTGKGLGPLPPHRQPGRPVETGRQRLAFGTRPSGSEDRPPRGKPRLADLWCLDAAPGAIRQGTLTNVAGKPVTGVRVVGLTDQTAPQKLDGSTFTATGLQPGASGRSSSWTRARSSARSSG